MNINDFIDPYSLAYGAMTGVIVGTCIYCIWNGRKIMKQWVEEVYPVAVPVRWEDDENNPANWYLKNPDKFKITSVTKIQADPKT